MKLKNIIIATLVMACTKANAQSFAINTTGAAAHNSAILDVTSTSKGMLVPRVSTAQRTAIVSPAKGLMVYDSTVNQFAYYNGTAWQLISTATNSWTVSGIDQYSSVSGNVGIGTNAPANKLHVKGGIRVDSGRIEFRNTGNSVFIGESAGINEDLNNRGNVFVGYRSGQANTTGNGNTFLGNNAGFNTTTGTLNTAVGISALDNNTTGTSNVAVGRSALSGNTNGFNNVGLGVGALQVKTTGSNNLAVGTNALTNLLSGGNNVAIGILAGNTNTNGSGNVFLGFSAGGAETGSNKLYIDNSNTAAPLIYGNFAADSLKVNGSLTVNNAYTLPTDAGATNQVLQTNGAGQAAWVNASTLTITEFDPQVSSATANMVPKWNGTALVDGLIIDNGTNVGIGIASPLAKLHVKGNLIVDAGRIEFRNNGQSVFVGENAGLNDNLTANNSTFVGYNSGRNSVSGSGNVALGWNALASATASHSSTAVGTDALRYATGGGNTALGYGAGSNATGVFNVFIGPTAGANETGNSKLYIDNSNTSTPLIYGDFNADIVTVNGSLGIGTTNPTQAKLVVNGSNANTLNSYGYLSRTTVGNTSASTTADYSIYASDRIAAAEFNAYSDARIKNIKGISNGQHDLQTLMGIEITDYSLKDFVAKGNKAYKKVIAQQVEKIYPQAVSKMTDVIPDIYQQTTMQNGIIKLPNTLKIGDKVKLIFESGEEMATVTAATATSFTVNKNKTGNVFVYGREVNDFRSVDYEAISMLNVSATQQLVKELQQQKERISQQQQQIDQLINELKMLRQPLPVSPGGAL